ncbi:hypothetical protein J5N97_001887 [Dioscorea zingiberensis]|uniref:Uncharacterized protein n=1 Tax=Dioscorea zingiberensis TaxID=325984 RepID=A0A9D5H209_9LILI|nr:hypothetical protein J5N97_001887 [Dioscorea zingiberensis]
MESWDWGRRRRSWTEERRRSRWSREEESDAGECGFGVGVRERRRGERGSHPRDGRSGGLDGHGRLVERTWRDFSDGRPLPARVPGRESERGNPATIVACELYKQGVSVLRSRTLILTTLLNTLSHRLCNGSIHAPNLSSLSNSLLLHSLSPISLFFAAAAAVPKRTAVAIPKTTDSDATTVSETACLTTQVSSASAASVTDPRGVPGDRVALFQRRRNPDEILLAAPHRSGAGRESRLVSPPDRRPGRPLVIAHRHDFQSQGPEPVREPDRIF